MKRKGFRFSAASSRPMSSGLAPERRYYSKKSARGIRYLAPTFFIHTVNLWFWLDEIVERVYAGRSLGFIGPLKIGVIFKEEPRLGI